MILVLVHFGIWSRLYEKYESNNQVDFWGMTNHRGIQAGNFYINEHLQSYFISFKKSITQSEVFQTFWKSVQSYEEVQKVLITMKHNIQNCLLMLALNMILF